MDKSKNISLLKGYSFSFQDDEKNTIEAWFSAISGLEKVYVNGQLISSQRNFSTNSTNIFKIGDNEYSTNLKVHSIQKGPIVCTLYKNKNPYKRQTLIAPQINTVNKLKYVVIGIVIGVLVALVSRFIQVYFGLSVQYTIILAMTLFILIVTVMFIGKEYKIQHIEEEVL